MTEPIDKAPTLPSESLAQLDHGTHVQNRRFYLLALAFFAMVAVAVRQDSQLSSQRDAIGDLTDILTRRTPVIQYIEDASEQQLCADALGVAYEIAQGRLFLAVTTLPLDSPEVAASRAAYDTAIVHLERIRETCPPVEIPEEP